jgi:hypothetical protein
MHVSNLIELAISLGLDIWLIVLLLQRRVRSHFPVFFSFILFETAAVAARLLTVSRYESYFYVFWMTEAVLLLLRLAALHEAFRWIYEGFYLMSTFRVLYYGAIVTVLGIAIRNALANPPVQAHPVIGVILDVEVAVNLLQAAVVTLFYVLLKPLAIEFRRYPFGIVGGFAVLSVIRLIAYMARSEFGTQTDAFTRQASAVAYILAVGMWLLAFAVPEYDENQWTPPMSPEQMLNAVRRYLDVLRISRKKERQ